MNISENQKKFIRFLAMITFCLMFALFLMRANYNILSLIRQQTFRTYSVNNGNEFKLVDKETVFDLPVWGKNMSYIDFLVQSEQNIDGKAKLEIFENNKSIYSIEEDDISTILTDGILRFPVEKVRLEINKNYTACLTLALKEPVELHFLADGRPWIREVYRAGDKWVYCLILGMIDVVCVAGLILIFRYGLSDRVFLTLSISAGIVAAIVVAPASQDDEYRHFIRAYELANGHVVSEFITTPGNAKGNLIQENNGMIAIATVPEELNQVRMMDNDYNYDDVSYIAELNYDISIDRFMTILSSEQTDETAQVSQAAVWQLSYFSYFPQVFGIWIGKLFGMRPFLLCYMARIGNVIVCSILVYICLRLIPDYRAGVWVVHFMPGVFMLRSSSSTDGLILALSMLLISYILYIRQKKKYAFSKKNIVILIFLTAYISILKLPYALLIGTLIILKPENYKKERLYFFKSVLLAGLIFTSAVIAYMLYGKLHMALVSSVVTNCAKFSGSALVDSTHIQYLMTQPREVLSLFGRYMTDIWNTYAGGVNGRIWIYGISYALWIFITMLMMKKETEVYQRILCFILFMGMWVVILFVFYSLTPVGSTEIIGLNCRYMIPMIPLLFAVIPQGNEQTTVLAEKCQVITLFGVMAGLINAFSVYWI